MITKNSLSSFPWYKVMIIMAMIGILIAIAIPGYIGMKERERSEKVYKTAVTSERELTHWILAVQNGGADSPYSGLREVDTNGDGDINSSDDTNLQLARNGMVHKFVAATIALDQFSPFNPANSLWVDGQIADTQSLCDSRAQATSNWGRIVLCYTPAQNQTLQTVFVSAADSDGNIIYRKALIPDQKS